MALISRYVSKRAALRLAVVAITFVAAGCEAINICNPDRPASESLPPAPTSAATSTAMTAATSAATTAAASGTSASAAAYGGTIKLGYDHPPFAQNYGVGGNSVALACGSLTGVPGGSIMINLSGGAGQPPSVIASVGNDGKFVAPFPIMQFGPLTATIGGVKNLAGADLKGSVPPVTLQVAGGADVACTP